MCKQKLTSYSAEFSVLTDVHTYASHTCVEISITMKYHVHVAKYVLTCLYLYFLTFFSSLNCKFCENVNSKHTLFRKTKFSTVLGVLIIVATNESQVYSRIAQKVNLIEVFRELVIMPVCRSV